MPDKASYLKRAIHRIVADRGSEESNSSFQEQGYSSAGLTEPGDTAAAMDESGLARHALFLRLFTMHEASVRAYIRRLMPSRGDADDVMQEVALVLWGKFPQFRDGCDFRTWAFGIARYEVLAWLRDRGRDRLVLAGDVAEMIAEESIVEEANLEQQRIALEKCMQKLTPHHRLLILESYRSELKIQDVALSSGRSIAGFYQWLHRMRRNLLGCIKTEVSRATCP